MTTAELSAARAEHIDAEYLFRSEAGTPEPAATDLGIATTRIGGGVAVSMRNDTSNFWSKAVGLGFAEPLTADLVEEVIAFYRANRNSRAAFQIAPEAQPADWAEIAAAHGLRAAHRTHRHAARIDTLQLGRTELRIDEVAPEQAEEFSFLVLDTFGMQREGLASMLAATVTNPDFRVFAAWDGDQMVAGAQLLVQGSVGGLFAGATRPEYRGRGAQTALIAARAKAAAAAGCEWVATETAISGPSNQNMLRAGMRTLYTRQNWIWEA